MRDDTERYRSIPDRPVAVGVLEEANRLADQRRADVDRVTLPLDLAVPAHAPYRAVATIMGLAKDAVEAARRSRVMLGRCIVAERCVRALLVVELLKATQARELLAQTARRRFGGVLQQRQ